MVDRLGKLCFAEHIDEFCAAKLFTAALSSDGVGFISVVYVKIGHVGDGVLFFTFVCSPACVPHLRPHHACARPILNYLCSQQECRATLFCPMGAWCHNRPNL